MLLFPCISAAVGIKTKEAPKNKARISFWQKQGRGTKDKVEVDGLLIAIIVKHFCTSFLNVAPFVHKGLQTVLRGSLCKMRRKENCNKTMQ